MLRTRIFADGHAEFWRSSFPGRRVKLRRNLRESVFCFFDDRRNHEHE